MSATELEGVVRRVVREELERAGRAKWLTNRGAARYLKVSVRTIDRMVNGGLPHRTVKGRRRFNLDDLDRALAEGQRGAAPTAV